MNLDSAVRTATFLRPAERPILTNTLATVLTAYDRPESDAYGLVGAISYVVTNGVPFREVAEFITIIAPIAAPHDTPIEWLLADCAQLRRQGFDAETATGYLVARFEGDAE